MKNMKIQSEINRCLAALTACLLLTPALLTSCKKSTPKNPVRSGEYYFSFFEGDELTAYLETISNDVKEDVLFYEVFYDTEGSLHAFLNKQDGNTLISQNKDTAGFDSKDLGFTDRIMAICPEGNDTLWLMKSELDSAYHISNSIFSYSLSDGNKAEPLSCPDLNDKSIVQMCRRADGSFVIATMEDITILDSEGKKQKSYSPAKNARFESMAVTDNGKIGAVYTIAGKDYAPVMILLSDKCAEEASFSLPGFSEENRIFGSSGGFGNTFFATSNAYIGILDTETKEWSHWVEKQSTESTNSLTEDGTAELFYNNGGVESVFTAYKNGETISFYGLGDGIIDSIEGFFSLSFHTYDPNRQTIRLGKLQNGLKFGYLNEVVDYYNRMQDQYFIEIVDYNTSSDPQLSDADNWRKSVTTFLSDLLTGNGPDLFVVQPSVEKALARQDGIADLAPYLTKAEQESMLPGILDLFDIGFGDPEAKDGTIHFLSPFFSVTGMAYDNQVKNSYSPDRTYSDWMHDSKTKKEYFTGFQESAASLFSEPICECVSESKDKATTIQALTELLEQVKEFCAHQKEMSSLDLDHPILQPVDIHSFQSYLDAASSFEAGGFIGNYPDTDATFGIHFDECYCISSHSEHKDAAWEFLSLLLHPNVQTLLNQAMIPVRKESFEKDIASIPSEKLPGNNDQTERDIKGYPTYPVSDVPALANEYKETVNDLLASSTKLYFVDDYIRELCYDTISSVREGAKTPSEAAALFYDQSSKYLQEVS